MPSRERIRFLAAVCLVLVAGGCSHIPFGISKAEWERLSAADQAKYRRLERTMALAELRENERFFEQQNAGRPPPPPYP